MCGDRCIDRERTKSIIAEDYDDSDLLRNDQIEYALTGDERRLDLQHGPQYDPERDTKHNISNLATWKFVAGLC